MNLSNKTKWLAPYLQSWVFNLLVVCWFRLRRISKLTSLIRLFIINIFLLCSFFSTIRNLWYLIICQNGKFMYLNSFVGVRCEILPKVLALWCFHLSGPASCLLTFVFSPNYFAIIYYSLSLSFPLIIVVFTSLHICLAPASYLLGVAFFLKLFSQNRRFPERERNNIRKLWNWPIGPLSPLNKCTTVSLHPLTLSWEWSSCLSIQFDISNKKNWWQYHRNCQYQKGYLHHFKWFCLQSKCLQYLTDRQITNHFKYSLILYYIICAIYSV